MKKREVTKIAEQKEINKETTQTTLVLNTKDLQKVLKHRDWCDLPVVVICLAGPFRTGKSFFLNLFLHYMLNCEVRYKL